MIINAGGPEPQLRKLWKDTFHDSEEYLDLFFRVAYSPERCRCITHGDQVLSMVYWFDATWNGHKLAYLFAAATDIRHRGQGLFRKLMADTHEHLKTQGYHGAVLSPAEPSLFDFYGTMGYKSFGAVDTFTCDAGVSPAEIVRLTPKEYSLRRRNLLPENSILQEGLTLDFLSKYSEFWAGADFLLCCAKEDHTLYVQELLGNTTNAPAIVAALDCAEGHFRTPGSTSPLAMYLPLTEDDSFPGYFGLPLD